MLCCSVYMQLYISIAFNNCYSVDKFNPRSANCRKCWPLQKRYFWQHMASIGSLPELHSTETYRGTHFCPFKFVGVFVYTLFIHGFTLVIKTGASRVNIASWCETILTRMKMANNLMELCWLRELSKSYFRLNIWKGCTNKIVHFYPNTCKIW